jgi:hypothetical protein
VYFTRKDETKGDRAAAFRKAGELMREALAASGFGRVKCGPPDIWGSNPSARGAVGRTFWQTAPMLLQYEFLAMPSESVQEDLLMGLLVRIMKSAGLSGTIDVSDSRIAKGILDGSRNSQITDLHCVSTLNITNMCPECSSLVSYVRERTGDISPLPMLRKLKAMTALPRGEALREAEKLLFGCPLSLEGLNALENLLGRWPDTPGSNILIKPDFVSWTSNYYPGISATAYSACYELGEGGLGGVNASGWFDKAEAAVLTGVLAAQNMAAVFLESGRTLEV